MRQGMSVVSHIPRNKRHRQQVKVRVCEEKATSSGYYRIASRAITSAILTLNNKLAV